MSPRLSDLNSPALARSGSVALSVALAVTGVLLAVTSNVPAPDPDAIQGPAWLLLVGALANLAVVSWDRSTVDIDTASGFIPLVLAAVLYGPKVTALVAVASSLPYLALGVRHCVRCLSTRLFSGVVVASVFVAADVHYTDPDPYVLSAFVAAAGYQLVQLWVTTAVLSIEFGGDPVARLRTLGPRFGVALLLFGPMVVSFAYLMPAAPAAVLMATFAAAASHQLLVTVSRSRNLERMLTDLSAEIPGALLAALDAADAYTAQHSAAVASYSYDIARAMGYDDRSSRRVHAAALLHDVGKIGVPDSVLTKAGKLDDDEWELMRRHPEMGASIVRRLPGFDVLQGGILHHHERMDGTGYPARMDGADIPVDAQIIAVADTYSAITTTRAYRKAKDPQFGISELLKDADNGRLNPDLVHRFVDLLGAANAAYRCGRHTALRHEVRKVRGWLEVSDRNALAGDGNENAV